MKRSRKRQLVFQGVNLFILLILFLALRNYDFRFRATAVLYERPIVEILSVGDASLRLADEVAIIDSGLSFQDP